jgi:ribosome-associated translation inhibitor RaiA
MIHGKEKTDDLYSAIDLVIDKLQRQVQKQKKKPSSIEEGRKSENYRLSNGESGYPCPCGPRKKRRP